MKTLMRTLTLAFVLFSVVPAWAQTYPSSTTLSAAITATQTQIRVASATGVQAGGVLIIDQEPLFIQSCGAACTTVNVLRTTRTIAHGSGAVVTVISKASKPLSVFTHNGAIRAGQCSTSTSSSAATALATAFWPTPAQGVTFLPVVDQDTGDFYMCRRTTGGRWEWTKTNVQGLNALDGSVWTAWP